MRGEKTVEVSKFGSTTVLVKRKISELIKERGLEVIIFPILEAPKHGPKGCWMLRLSDIPGTHTAGSLKSLIEDMSFAVRGSVPSP